MKQNVLKLTMVALLLGTATVAFADVSVDANAGAQVRPATFLEALKVRLGIQQVRVETKTEVKDIRTEAQNKIDMMRENEASTTREMKDEMKDRMASSTEKREDMMEKRIDNRFNKMNARFDATVIRLDGIMMRVNSRIEKIKNAGGNTTPAEKFVADATVSLNLAKTGIVNLKAMSTTTVELENATTTMKQAKTSLIALAKLAKAIEKNLQDTRTSLEKAVGSLKGLSQVNATTTVKVKTNEQ